MNALSRTRSLLCPALAGLCVILPSAGARAEIRVEKRAAVNGITMLVNTLPVATLVTDTRATAAERAAVVERRLKNLARADRPVRFTVGKVLGDYAVLVNSGVIIAPGHGDAVRAVSSRRALAHQWAAHLQRAWDTPLLRLSSSGLTIGVGSASSFRVSGILRGPLGISVSPEGVGAVSTREDGRIVVSGLKPGRGVVTVSRDGSSAALAFRVLHFAGSVKAVNLEVTGRGIPDDLIAGLVESETRRAVTLQPNAWFVVRSWPKYPSVWRRGDELTYRVPVRIAGPGYLPVETSVPVRVVRRKMDRPREVVLLYSNDPEQVKKTQVLFRHTLPATKSARLLYHHQNRAMAPLMMAIDLKNESPRNMPVHILDGSVPAELDTVLVGHRAAYKYMDRAVNDVGVIVTVPANGSRRILVRRLGSNDTLSGLMQFRPLEEGSLTVSLRAEDPRTGGVAATLATSDTVFPDPDKTIDAEYSVGGPWAHVPIGRFAVKNDAGVKLSGNYGVLYTVRLTLKNPTHSRRSVRVLFEAQAGRASGVFLIDGTLTETPSVFPPSEFRIATIPLAPGETRTVTIVTMPAAGGSYPAGLIVHA